TSDFSENEGEVLLGGLDWSGNFKVDFEKDPQDNLRIIAGINNHASHYALAPNKTFTTPRFTFTLSTTGLGQGSRNFHDWARSYRLIDGFGSRYTLLNNWESTYFDFNESRSEEHTSELQSRENLVCRLLLEKKK